jgi:uncharacterized membrane protein (UPF0127 family)
VLRDPRWRLAAAGVAVLVVASALALVVAADDGKDAASVATGTTTSTSLPDDDAIGAAPTSTSVAPTTVTTSTTSTHPPPVTTAATTPASTAPGSCPRPAPGSDFEGFGATEIVIDNAEGSHRSCVLTADTPAQQRQGLMRQDDIGAYDGMIFRFASAEERAFWMRNTSMPLTIAFFDAGGAFVSQTDMEPCGDRSDCPTYPSHGASKFALEVMRGHLAATGGGPGSRLVT